MSRDSGPRSRRRLRFDALEDRRLLSGGPSLDAGPMIFAPAVPGMAVVQLDRPGFHLGREVFVVVAPAPGLLERLAFLGGPADPAGTSFPGGPPAWGEGGRADRGGIGPADHPGDGLVPPGGGWPVYHWGGSTAMAPDGGASDRPGASTMMAVGGESGYALSGSAVLVLGGGPAYPASDRSPAPPVSGPMFSSSAGLATGSIGAPAFRPDYNSATPAVSVYLVRSAPGPSPPLAPAVLTGAVFGPSLRFRGRLDPEGTVPISALGGSSLAGPPPGSGMILGSVAGPRPGDTLWAPLGTAVRALAHPGTSLAADATAPEPSLASGEAPPAPRRTGTDTFEPGQGHSILSSWAAVRPVSASERATAARPTVAVAVTVADAGGGTQSGEGAPSPRGADLIAEALPFDRDSLERALDRFVLQLEDLDLSALVSHGPAHWVFYSLTLLASATALELARRSWRRRGLSRQGLRVADPLGRTIDLGFPELPGSWSERPR